MNTMRTAPADGDTSHGTGLRPPYLITVAGYAGIAGPVLFTAVFLAQEAFRRGEYDPLAEPVSALEAGPNGWVQQLNFIVFGVLTILFAIGLHRGVRPTKAGVAGPALLGASGVGLLLAAAFPLREDAAGVTYDPGGHLVAGLVFFLSSAAGLVVLSRRLSRDPRWRSLARYTRAVGVAVVAGGIVMNTLVIPDGGPLHDWAGLVQRAIILLALFPCRVVLSARLLRVGRGQRR
jgi:hypothetical membrane protein